MDMDVKIVPFTRNSLLAVRSNEFIAGAHLLSHSGYLQGATRVDTMETTKGDLDVPVLQIILNQDAYNEMLLSFSDLVNLNLVDDACTDELPVGDALLTWPIFIFLVEVATVI